MWPGQRRAGRAQPPLSRKREEQTVCSAASFSAARKRESDCGGAGRAVGDWSGVNKGTPRRYASLVVSTKLRERPRKRYAVFLLGFIRPGAGSREVTRFPASVLRACCPRSLHRKLHDRCCVARLTSFKLHFHPALKASHTAKSGVVHEELFTL